MRRLAAALIVLLLASPATAQQRSSCIPYEQAARQLGERHAEQPIHRGVADDHVIEVWFDSEGGGWTILRVVPTATGKLACMITYGYGGWHDVAPTMRPGERGT